MRWNSLKMYSSNLQILYSPSTSDTHDHEVMIVLQRTWNSRCLEEVTSPITALLLKISLNFIFSFLITLMKIFLWLFVGTHIMYPLADMIVFLDQVILPQEVLLAFHPNKYHWPASQVQGSMIDSMMYLWRHSQKVGPQVSPQVGFSLLRQQNPILSTWAMNTKAEGPRCPLSYWTSMVIYSLWIFSTEKT